jgi:hypothetical protein
MSASQQSLPLPTPQTGVPASSGSIQTLARLYYKQSAACKDVQRRLAEQGAFPGDLDLVVSILNQFDHGNFAVLWFSMNLTLFLSQHFAVQQGKRASMEFLPITTCKADDPSAFPQAFSRWKMIFEGTADFTEENVKEILVADRSSSQLQMFVQAFKAVWLRDFQKPLGDVDATRILHHLFMLVSTQASSGESHAIVKHVLVTFVHIASKAYEMISRSLK